MAKTLTQLQSDLDDLKMDIKAWETAYEQSHNDDEKIKLRIKIDEARGLVLEIEKQIEIIAAKEKKQQKKKTWDQERILVDKAIEDNSIGYIIPENKFIYCRNHGVGQDNVQFKMVSAHSILRVLDKMTGVSIKGKDQDEIIDYFESLNKNYLDITSSFNNAKWNESEIYNKMTVIKKHWLQPIFDDEPVDPSFDLLLHSVCGGKEENIRHFKDWIIFKYLFPEKNISIPNIDLCGQPGGNGKQITIELLKTIFTPSCVISAHREELEKFNSNWEMAVVLYYDEPEEKDLAANKLKQATGSQDMRIEKKGIDATMADRNYNFLFLSNNEKGVVKLSGGGLGGEDRRYSVISTNLVLFDLYKSSGLSDEQVREELNKLANVTVKDRKKVARWLGREILASKFNSGSELGALHGVDYHNRFEEQKESIIEAFDKLLPVVESQSFIPLSLLSELVRVLTENDAFKDKNVGAKFENYLRRNQIDYTVQGRKQWHSMWNGVEVKTTQNKCYILNTGNPEYQFEMNTVRVNNPKIGPITKDNCELM
jgi:hypothetical protein